MVKKLDVRCGTCQNYNSCDKIVSHDGIVWIPTQSKHFILEHFNFIANKSMSCFQYSKWTHNEKNKEEPMKKWKISCETCGALYDTCVIEKDRECAFKGECYYYGDKKSTEHVYSKWTPNKAEVERFYNVPAKKQAPKDPYASLKRVLDLAVKQASDGKGKERHVTDANQAFENQPIMTITKMVGSSGPMFQVMKKLQESLRLPKEAALREILGAINYCVAVYLSREEGE